MKSKYNMEAYLKQRTDHQNSIQKNIPMMNYNVTLNTYFQADDMLMEKSTCRAYKIQSSDKKTDKVHININNIVHYY